MNENNIGGNNGTSYVNLHTLIEIELMLIEIELMCLAKIGWNQVPKTLYVPTALWYTSFLKFFVLHAKHPVA